MYERHGPCSASSRYCGLVITLRVRVALVLFFICASPSRAGESAQGEIDHLIDYVARSNCTFIRNGFRGDSDAAANHLRRKYRYARDRLTTAEQFIDYIASRSSITGRPYVVECPGHERQESGLWLRQELSRFRTAAR